MTISEAQAELMILRGLAESGNDLALVKERIDRLYFAVCGKHLRKCKCKNVYKDALLEIYAKLSSNTKKTNTMAKSRLVAGVVLQVDGNHYTNKNLTDEVARKFLAKFPMRKDWFEVLPSAPKKVDEAKDAEVPDNGTEIPPKEIKPTKKPSMSKKKKKTAKGK